MFYRGYTMSISTKIIVTQVDGQHVTPYDIAAIALSYSQSMHNPLFVLFDEDSLQALLNRERPGNSLTINTWNETTQTNLDQILRVHDSIILFKNDYDQAAPKTKDGFDSYIQQKLSRNASIIVCPIEEIRHSQPRATL